MIRKKEGGTIKENLQLKEKITDKAATYVKMSAFH